MKPFRFVLFVVVMSLFTLAFAQSVAQKSADNSAPANPPKSADKPAPSEAQKAFDTMKTFAGEWEGSVTVVPEVPEMKDAKPMHVSIRVTSRGHALVHELQTANTPLDATKYDHPVTMVYMDGDQLNLIHYCDAGNRPRMIGKLSPDGKTVEFEFADISGNAKYGHMHHGKFTYIDANHHLEDWTFMLPGDQAMHAHVEMHRVN